MLVLNNICSEELLAKMRSYLDSIAKAKVVPSHSLILQCRANVCDVVISMLHAKNRDKLTTHTVLLLKNYCWLMYMSDLKTLDDVGSALDRATKTLRIASDLNPTDLFEIIFEKQFTDFLNLAMIFLKVHMGFCKKLDCGNKSDVKTYFYSCAVFLYIYSWFVLYPCIVEYWDDHNVETLPELY